VKSHCEYDSHVNSAQHKPTTPPHLSPTHRVSLRLSLYLSASAFVTLSSGWPGAMQSSSPGTLKPFMYFVEKLFCAQVGSFLDATQKRRSGPHRPTRSATLVLTASVAGCLPALHVHLVRRNRAKFCVPHSGGFKEKGAVGRPPLLASEFFFQQVVLSI